MVQFFQTQPGIPDTRQQSLAEALGMGLSQVGQGIAGQKKLQKQEKTQSGLAQGLFGEQAEQFKNLSPEQQIALYGQIQKKGIAEQTRLQRQELESQKKTLALNEKIEPFRVGLGHVERMRAIGKKGNLGFGITARKLARGETSRDAAEYGQLGKALISLSTTIPIRNRLEFETLAGELIDPSLSDAARDGLLDAMDRVLQGGIQKTVGSFQEKELGKEEKQQQQERPPLSSFYK